MQHNFRVDIQALRGLAVLLVVFFHARTPYIAGGYLGVDIFFVISGYLITTQVARAIQAGSFSFTDFYARRALRLLPAAYTVLLACLIVSPWLLNSVEWDHFLDQLLGAVFFAANVVLWQQTDYFSPTAEYKVLLHMWSLSIEEQYYLLLPAALFFVHRKFWLVGAIAITIVSLILYSIAIEFKPISAFFLLPARAWELGIGSTLALILLRTQLKVPTWLLIAAVVILLLVPLYPLPAGRHNELIIALVCVAAAIVISANAGWVNENPVSRILAWFGTISYSLYLVHWPVFSFLHNANIAADLALPARLFGLAVSVGLAILLYRFIEQTFRVTGKDTVIPRKKIFLLLIVSILVVVATLATKASLSSSEFSHRMRFNIGLSDTCEASTFHQQPECRTSNNPELLLWGDSFSMHIASGIAQTRGSKMIQAAYSACAGVSDIALVRPPREIVKWSKACVEHNDEILDYIARTDSIKIVVMASQWSYFFEPKSIYDRGSDSVLENHGTEAVVPYIKKTVDRIHAAGKKVVFVEPPPWGEFDFGRCHERQRTDKWSFGAGKHCVLTREDADRVRKGTDDMIAALSAKDIVPIFRTKELLCDDKECKTHIDDTILYRDHTHFSYEGSIRFAQDFDLVRNLYQLTGLPVPKDLLTQL